MIRTFVCAVLTATSAMFLACGHSTAKLAPSTETPAVALDAALGNNFQAN